MWQLLFLTTSALGKGVKNIYKENLNIKSIILDLLFISEKIVLEVPTFRKFPCKFVDPWPFSEDVLPAGIVNNSLVACDRRQGCSRLAAGQWTGINDMKTPRHQSGASSSSLGLFVTGGYDSIGNRLKTTELLTSEGEWIPGPDLPVVLSEHCQVKRENQIFVIGKQNLS